jgi:prepilin signal peptidase PulO-like enzyme (type II secretory pathway)
LRIGRLAGVEVHLNNAFLALLGLFFVAGVLVKGLIAFAVVLLHELAHVAAARRFGVYVQDVELLPFGGVSRMGSEVVFDPSKEVGGMGGGDIKLAALIGFFLGWPNGLLAVFLGCLLGAVTGITLVLTGLKGRKDAIPFGPYLALGTLPAMFFGDKLLAWYLGLF